MCWEEGRGRRCPEGGGPWRQPRPPRPRPWRIPKGSRVAPECGVGVSSDSTVSGVGATGGGGGDGEQGGTRDPAAGEAATAQPPHGCATGRAVTGQRSRTRPPPLPATPPTHVPPAACPAPPSLSPSPLALLSGFCSATRPVPAGTDTAGPHLPTSRPSPSRPRPLVLCPRVRKTPTPPPRRPSEPAHSTHTRAHSTHTRAHTAPTRALAPTRTPIRPRVRHAPPAPPPQRTRMDISPERPCRCQQRRKDAQGHHQSPGPRKSHPR